MHCAPRAVAGAGVIRRVGTKTMKSFCQQREISVAAGGQNYSIETVSITFATKAQIYKFSSRKKKKPV